MQNELSYEQIPVKVLPSPSRFAATIAMKMRNSRVSDWNVDVLEASLIMAVDSNWNLQKWRVSVKWLSG